MTFDRSVRLSGPSLPPRLGPSSRPKISYRPLAPRRSKPRSRISFALARYGQSSSVTVIVNGTDDAQHGDALDMSRIGRVFIGFRRAAADFAAARWGEASRRSNTSQILIFSRRSKSPIRLQRRRILRLHGWSASGARNQRKLGGSPTQPSLRTAIPARNTPPSMMAALRKRTTFSNPHSLRARPKQTRDRNVGIDTGTEVRRQARPRVHYWGRWRGRQPCRPRDRWKTRPANKGAPDLKSVQPRFRELIIDRQRRERPACVNRFTSLCDRLADF